MYIVPRLAAVLALSQALPSHAPAADPPPAGSDPLAGHSYHGEAFNEGPRQAAYLMGGTGNVHFPVTTTVPQAQQFFDQGIGQLHGFWYFEAERSFRQVAALDPSCAMAYWGMALANTENEKRAKGFIEKAVERKESASDMERMWIDALAAYHGSKDDKGRRREYVRALESIIHEYPDLVEAKAFLAVQLWFNSGRGWPISSHEAVGALLDQVFAVEPMHPAHHYAIHLWDYEKAERAIHSAARSGQSAPSIAHMWHMGGHIFAKLERFADSAWQQEASARVDHAQMMRDHVLPDQIHNYAHNNEWLVRNLSHIGRVRDAIALANNMIELPRHPKYNVLDGRGSAGFGRKRLFEVLERYELWDEVIALAETTYLEPTDIDVEKVRTHRLVGLARFGRGEVDEARREIAALEKLLEKGRDERHAAALEGERKSREKGESDDKVLEAMSAAMKPFSRKLRPIEEALAELRGEDGLFRGDAVAAGEQFARAGRIPKERRALRRLRAGETDEAIELAREAYDAAKNEVVPLAVYVHVLRESGRREEAVKEFEELRKVAAAADLDAPPLRRLEPLARELELPADWKLRPEPPGDTGERPDLATLGPFRWHPPAAAPWSLRDGQGREVSLSDYRGRALLLIFYLGAGCVHCVEQLEVFAPRTEDFTRIGVSTVAVSTEASDALQVFPVEGASSELPFPLLSDEPLAVFKAYRAYDDFENMPLHGTFLIDGAGRILWQDVSFEPFTDARFLLSESQRLLGLHGGLDIAKATEEATGSTETSSGAGDEPEVPDGTAEEFLAFIEGIRSGTRLESAGAAAKERAVAEAAERLIAKKPEASVLEKARSARLEALVALVAAGEVSRLGDLTKWIESAPEDERARGAAEAASLLYERVRAALERPDAGARQVAAAERTARWIEARGEIDTARAACRDFGGVLSRSKSPSVALIGRKLEGAARRRALAGEPAEIRGTTLAGEAVEPEHYAGKPLLVSFWASWNGGSADEFERVKEVRAKYASEGLEVIAVSLDRNRQSLEAYAKAHEIDCPVLFSENPLESGWDHPMALYYGIRELPRALLVGPDGRAVALARSASELDAEIGKLLAPPAAGGG